MSLDTLFGCKKTYLYKPLNLDRYLAELRKYLIVELFNDVLIVQEDMNNHSSYVVVINDVRRVDYYRAIIMNPKKYGNQLFEKWNENRDGSILQVLKSGVLVEIEKIVTGNDEDLSDSMHIKLYIEE